MMLHHERPVLFGFDGSANAEHAISQASELLTERRAVVLCVWEPAPVWEPYDPATILSTPVSKLASKLLDFDEVIEDMARGKAEHGADLAIEAGFAAEFRVVGGKPWRVICDLAEEIDAAAIVVGARGLSRAGSMLLGSVSFAVAVHAKRPVVIIHPG